MTPVVRTPAQADASRRNGARSIGPVTPEGRTVAGTNGIEHGLSSRAALLPSESVEHYEAVLGDWIDTLRPRSRAEAQLVARIGDLAFRQVRLSRMEELVINDALERRLKETATAKALGLVQEALAGAGGVAALAEHVTAEVDAVDVGRLLPGLRSVAALISRCGLPSTVMAELELAIDQLVADSIADVAPAAFQRLGRASRRVEAAAVSQVGELEKALEAERERLASAVLLGGGPESALLERHRGRLARAFEAELKALKLVRELSPGDSDALGSLVPPVKVELRMVGGRTRL
jgi:hypothetical protein